MAVRLGAADAFGGGTSVDVLHGAARGVLEGAVAEVGDAGGLGAEPAIHVGAVLAGEWAGGADEGERAVFGERALGEGATGVGHVVDEDLGELDDAPPAGGGRLAGKSDLAADGPNPRPELTGGVLLGGAGAAVAQVGERSGRACMLRGDGRGEVFEQLDPVDQLAARHPWPRLRLADRRVPDAPSR